MMMNCPKCGAGNKPDAQSCRMCAQPLDRACNNNEDRRKDSSTSTEVFPDLRTRAGTMVMSELSRCPHCSATNEAGWVFCQQCGKRLGEASVQPADKAGGEAPVVAEPLRPAPLPEAANPSRGQPPPELLPGWNFDPNQATVELPVVREPAPPAAAPDSIAPLPPPAPAPIVTGRLRLVVEGGDTETVYDLKDETVIGRRRGDITFAHDGFMSNSHARIVRRSGGFFLTDEGSRNGVYVKLKDPVKLESGDFILVGRQLFQFKA